MTADGVLDPAENGRRRHQQNHVRLGMDSLIVVGMVSSGFTIADPDDRGMMDIVGMDAAVPQLMSDFMRA